MKKIILAILVSMLQGMSYAGEFKNNPDRYTSLGVDYAETRVGLTEGVGEIFDPTDKSVNWVAPNGTLKTSQAIFDFRAPVSDRLTFSAHGGPVWSSYQSSSHTGYSVGAGLRVYLPELTN